MNKVWVLPANESWICDRFVSEWSEDNADITTSDYTQADVLWLLSDWAWKQVPSKLLVDKKIITTVHHIVPEKFDLNAQVDFAHRDQITDVYHVYNQRTYEQIKALTQKPIVMIQYWANNKIWRPTSTKEELRKKHGLPLNRYILGSFQRDTEGNGISGGRFLPKLEKGPDLLAEYIMKCRLRSDHPRHVLLAGWRRQYIIKRLQDNCVPFTYIERPSQETINELYQALDEYPVTARHEGGPQSLIECGLLNVPVVSRPVGIAEQVLPSSAINDDVFFAEPAIPNISSMLLPDGYKPYRELIQSL
jgi:hypothetical protein